MQIEPTDALIVVDVQNDFCEGGALAVPRADEIVSVVNRLMLKFPTVVLTQDWHPVDHRSFAVHHDDKEPFSTTKMHYGHQVLWPTHCVQDTWGSQFHELLALTAADLILRKGTNPAVDSYSAFRENDKTTKTGLSGYLIERGVERVFLTGLALDFCVGYSAVDAVLSEFNALVIEDACRAIDLNGSLQAMMHQFKRYQIPLIQSTSLADLRTG